MSDVAVNVLDDVTRAGVRSWVPRVARPARLPAMSLNPSTVVFTTARAVARSGGPAGMPTVAWESGLLLETVECTRGLPLHWHPAFQGAHPHLRHFVTESLGLALTVEYARCYGWDARRRLLNIDALGPGWAWLKTSGPRPDVVFGTPGGLYAAESRGRTSGRRGRVRGSRTALKDQKDRCEQIEDWATWAALQGDAWDQAYVAGLAGGMAWFMSWAEISPVDARIDVFDPGSPMILSAEGRAAWEQAHREAASQQYQAGLAEGGASAVIYGEDCVLADRPVRPLTNQTNETNDGDERDGLARPAVQLVIAQTPGVFLAEPGPDERPLASASGTTVGQRRVIDWLVASDMVIAVVEADGTPLERDEQISLLSSLIENAVRGGPPTG